MVNEEGCFKEFRLFKEWRTCNGEIEMRDRSDWLPPFERQIGIGYFDTSEQGVVYLLEDGSFQMISKNIDQFLTIPYERVFETKQEELFFCLLHRREWYLLLKDGTFYARYSK